VLNSGRLLNFINVTSLTLLPFSSNFFLQYYMLFTFSVLPSIGSNSSNAMCAVPLKNQQNVGLKHIISFILFFLILSSVSCGGIQTLDHEIMRQIFYHCVTVKRLHETQHNDTQHNAIQLNDTQHNNKSNSTIGIIALSIMTHGTKCWCFSG
jgi:hypothetical protein